MYIPDRGKPEEITGVKLNFTKSLEELSRTLWSPYLSLAVSTFPFAEKTVKEVISELYLNLSLKALSKNEESQDLRFDALTDLCIEINVRLNNSIFANKSRQKKEKIKWEIKISEDFDFPEEKIYNSEDDLESLNDSNENISDKIKNNAVDKFVPKTAGEIEQKDKIKRDTFLEDAVKFNGTDIELSNQRDGKSLTDLVDDIVSDEKPINDDIEEIFIDESNIFDHINITDDDKKFIIDIIDRTDFSFDAKSYNHSDDVKMEVVKDLRKRLKTKIWMMRERGRKISRRLYNAGE